MTTHSGMSQSREMKSEGFKWGVNIGVAKNNKNFRFFQSFTYNGVEYFLYDCVYLYVGDDPEPSIGKIVRICETPKGDKKVKLVWFFRPSEIRNFLGAYQPKWNEIFLASGRGIGLSNFNPLEAISGKCNVVCTSKDNRNPQSSEEELRMAEYSFCCTFDVGEQKILDKFPDEIDGINVDNFFNKKKVQKLSHHQLCNSNMKILTGKSCTSNSIKGHLVKDRKPSSSMPVVNESLGSMQVKLCSESLPLNASDDQHYKKRKLLLGEEEDNVPESAIDQPVENMGAKRAEKHNEDKSKWFAKLPWKERMNAADEGGTLVLLHNLDPSFTSSEVEDFVWQAFNEKVDSKMIQQNIYSSPHCGQALVIFKSRKAAASALDKLQNGCLMLADRRRVVGTKGKPAFPGKLATFVGHLDLSIYKRRSEKEMRKAIPSAQKAVSTAHCSQSNNLENDMAMDWLLLQDESDRSWNELHRQQKEEIEDLRNQLKLTWAK